MPEEHPESASRKRAMLHQKPKKAKKRKGNDESESQDSMSTSEEEKDLGKEETTKLEESSHLDSSEGINTLLFVTILWVTLLKRDQ